MRGPKAGQRLGCARRGPGSALGFETRQPRRRSRGHWGAAFVGGGELRLRGEGRAPGAPEQSRAERCVNSNLWRWPGRGEHSGNLGALSGSGPCHCQIPGTASLSALRARTRVCVFVCMFVSASMLCIKP